jgi:hypothetical protein
MSYANSKQRNGFLLAIVHIVNRDWNELVKLYVRLGFIPEGTDLRVIEDALENALPDILNADVTELNFKTVINKLGDIMCVSIKCYHDDIFVLCHVSLTKIISFNLGIRIHSLFHHFTSPSFGVWEFWRD